MVLAHREELIYQAAQKIQHANPDLSVTIEMGRKKAEPGASVVVASIPTLLRGERLAKFDPKEFKLLVIDEVHHVAADSYWRVQEHFGADGPESPVYVAGFSATLNRHDGQSLSRSLDYIAYHREMREMVEDGYLCPMELKQVKADVAIDYGSLRTRDGDYSAAPLARELNRPEFNNLVVYAWQRYAEHGRRCRSALAFAVNIAHAEGLAEAFWDHGVDARVVTSHTKTNVRDETLAAFRRGEFPVLINCGILTEGTDIPNIDMIILNRPTRSGPLMLQMIGRGLRPAPGKDRCVLIDMFEASQYTQGMFTIPSLLGVRGPASSAGVLDVTEAELISGLEDNGESHSLERRPEPEITRVDVKRVNVDAYDSALDYFAQASDTEAAVHATSLALYEFAHKFYLFGIQKSARYIRIQRAKGKFEVVLFHEKPKWGPPRGFSRYYTRRIAARDTMAEAVKEAENFVSTVEPGNFPPRLVSKHAAWRRRPASQQQHRILETLLWARSRAKRLDIDWPVVKALSSGQVSCLIALSHTGTTTCCDWLLKSPLKRSARKTKLQFEPVSEGPLVV